MSTMRRALVVAHATLTAITLAGCLSETPVEARIWRRDVVPAGTTQSRAFRLEVASFEGAPDDASLAATRAPRDVDVLVDVVAGQYSSAMPVPGDHVIFEVYVDGALAGVRQAPVQEGFSIGEQTENVVVVHLDCERAEPTCSHVLEVRVTPTTVLSVVQVSYDLEAQRTLTNRRGEHDGTAVTWTMLLPDP